MSEPEDTFLKSDPGPSKVEFLTKEARIDEAKRVVVSLSRKPQLAIVFGSSVDGTFKSKSDIDVFALYETAQDVPLEEIMKRGDSDSGLIDGTVDYQYFEKDSEHFKRHPEFLTELIESMKERGIVLEILNISEKIDERTDQSDA